MANNTSPKTYPGICRVGQTDTQKTCSLAEWAVLAWLHGGDHCQIGNKSEGSLSHDMTAELARLQRAYPKLRYNFEKVFGTRVNPNIPKLPGDIAGIGAHEFKKVNMQDATPADHNI